MKALQSKIQQSAQTKSPLNNQGISSFIEKKAQVLIAIIMTS
jgi:hypothetical protein